jgi:hypothetical protein
MPNETIIFGNSVSNVFKATDVAVLFLQVGSFVMTCGRSHACESRFSSVFLSQVQLTLTERRCRGKSCNQPFSSND